MARITALLFAIAATAASPPSWAAEFSTSDWATPLGEDCFDKKSEKCVEALARYLDTKSTADVLAISEEACRSHVYWA